MVLNAGHLQTQLLLRMVEDIFQRYGLIQLSILGLELVEFSGVCRDAKSEEIESGSYNNFSPDTKFKTAKECVDEAASKLNRVKAIEYNIDDGNCRVVQNGPVTVGYGEGVGYDNRKAKCFIAQYKGR